MAGKAKLRLQPSACVLSCSWSRKEGSRVWLEWGHPDCWVSGWPVDFSPQLSSWVQQAKAWAAKVGQSEAGCSCLELHDCYVAESELSGAAEIAVWPLCHPSSAVAAAYCRGGILWGAVPCCKSQLVCREKAGGAQVTGDKESVNKGKIQSHHGQLLWVRPGALQGSGLQCHQEGVSGKWGQVFWRQVQFADAEDAEGARGCRMASTSSDLWESQRERQRIIWHSNDGGQENE